MIFIIIDLQFFDQLIVSSVQLRELNEILSKVMPVLIHIRGMFS